jgi:hypothetical protein
MYENSIAAHLGNENAWDFGEGRLFAPIRTYFVLARVERVVREQRLMLEQT